MPSYRTGTENLAGGIQAAFDTYYRRKEGQKGREFAGEQAGLDREARMKELQKRIDSAEREGDSDRANRLKIEQEGIAAGKYESKQIDVWTRKEEDAKSKALDVAKLRIDQAMKKVKKYIDQRVRDGKSWSYKDLKKKYPELPDVDIQSWQLKNMKDNVNLALDFLRSEITEVEMGNARMGSILEEADLTPFFTDNKYLTMEYTWNQEKYDVEEERAPLFEGTEGGLLGKIPTVKEAFTKFGEIVPPIGETLQKGFQGLFGKRK